MSFVLVTLGAGVAVSVELLEALAIVLAVGVSRRWSGALIGAAYAAGACALLAAVLGPVLVASVPLDAGDSHVRPRRQRALHRLRRQAALAATDDASRDRHGASGRRC
jgi:hypothetical protein